MSPPKVAPERNRIMGVFRLGLAALSRLLAKGRMRRGVRPPPEPRPPPPDGLNVVLRPETRKPAHASPSGEKGSSGRYLCLISGGGAAWFAIAASPRRSDLRQNDENQDMPPLLTHEGRMGHCPRFHGDGVAAIHARFRAAGLVRPAHASPRHSRESGNPELANKAAKRFRVRVPNPGLLRSRVYIRRRPFRGRPGLGGGGPTG